MEGGEILKGHVDMIVLAAAIRQNTQ